jgi:hypothetical protein
VPAITEKDAMTQPTPTEKQDALARLATIEGRWTGQTTLWMEPEKPALEGPFTLSAERVAEGEALLVRYEGKHGDESALGVMLLGFDGEKREVHATWVDSFHTGGGPMVLTGPLRDDVVADLVGTWYWEGQPFGWRIEIRRPQADTLEWRMFNRMDQEYPATACTFQRA